MNNATSKTNERPTVLVTGSSGLIGSRAVRDLLDDYRVIGLDLKEPESMTDGLIWVRCDMTDDDSVSSAVSNAGEQAGQRLASVVHLAAYYDFSGAPSPLYQQLTVEGTRRLLRALRSLQVEQFIFSSTLLAQKPSEDGPLSAHSPTEAEWHYPQSKLDAEQVIEEERADIPAVILRLAGAYDEDGHSPPITQQIRRIYEKQLESYFFPGDKTHGQAFVHLDDIVTCLQCTIEKRRELPSHDVFVIGEEDVMSYEELQDRIGELIHGRQWPTIQIPKTAAKVGAWAQEKLASSEEDKPFIKPWMIDLADQNYPVDIARARRKLGWEPSHTLRQTLPEMVHRLLIDPQRWYELNGLPLPSYLQDPATTRS